MLSPTATARIISRLRPRSVQEILTSFPVYRRYFLTFLQSPRLCRARHMVVQLLNALAGHNARLQLSTLSNPSFSSTTPSTRSITIGAIVLVCPQRHAACCNTSARARSLAVADSHPTAPTFGVPTRYVDRVALAGALGCNT